MKTSFILSLVSALLVSHECHAFGVSPAIVKSTSARMTVLASHAIGPEDAVSCSSLEIQGRSAKTANEEAPAMSNSDSEMATVVSIAGLTMLAGMLGMSDSNPLAQNLQHMDEGSAATFIVHPVFLGVAGLVSLIPGDREASSTTRP